MLNFDNNITWQDDEGTVHVLPVAGGELQSLDFERTSEITEHAVEQGSPIADHIIRKPSTLTLSVLRSQTPVYENDGLTSKTLETQPSGQGTRQLKPLDLDVRQSEFKPGGLLLLTSALRGAITAGVDAIFGSINPVPDAMTWQTDGKASGGHVQAHVYSIAQDTDLIDQLLEDLIRVQDNAYPITVNYLGRTYDSMFINGLRYVRNGDQEAGDFQITLRQVFTATTQLADLPDPSQLRMKNTKSKGSKPAKPPDTQVPISANAKASGYGNKTAEDSDGNLVTTDRNGKIIGEP